MAPIITPDFNERKLPPGTYRAKIVNCEQKTSPKGSTYLNWKFETQTGNYELDRFWVYHMTGLSGKGAQALKQLVQAAKDPTYESGPINTDDLLGCFVSVKVEKGLNQDGTESPYLKVMDVMPDNEPFDVF